MHPQHHSQLSLYQPSSWHAAATTSERAPATQNTQQSVKCRRALSCTAPMDEESSTRMLCRRHTVTHVELGKQPNCMGRLTGPGTTAAQVRGSPPTAPQCDRCPAPHEASHRRPVQDQAGERPAAHTLPGESLRGPCTISRPGLVLRARALNLCRHGPRGHKTTVTTGSHA
jgi:hypothetical protein